MRYVQVRMPTQASPLTDNVPMRDLQEYMVTCHVSVFSRVADRRLSKEWNVWHRFSEFDGLNECVQYLHHA
jgi:hypothetical protein